MPENKKDTSPKVKIRARLKDLAFDIADGQDRIVFSFCCINKVHFYYVDYSIKHSTSFNEVKEFLNGIKKVK